MEHGLFKQYGVKKALRKMKWATVDHSKSPSASKEGDTVYLVELEGHCLLQDPSAKSDVEIRQFLFPIKLIKGSNWWKTSEIGQFEECCLPLMPD